MASCESRPMSTVDRWAIRILAAARLGLNPNYVQEAEDQLKGKPLPPMMDVSMCREACALNHRLSIDESVVCEANENVAELMSKYGLNESSPFDAIKVRRTKNEAVLHED